MKRRLIVFARVPRLGAVKTRLAAGIGEAAALEAYRGLLAQALRTAARARADSRVLCIAGDDAEGECARLAEAHGMSLALQRGDSLGERMQAALAAALDEGFAPVLIGCDAPSLTAADLEAAFAALAGHDAVFAPAEDGGYALVGCRRSVPEAFEALDWGTSTVMDATRERLRKGGIGWFELRTVWDVDELPDLKRWQALDEDAPDSGRRQCLRGGLACAASLACGGGLLARPQAGRASSAATALEAGVARFSTMTPGQAPTGGWREQRLVGVAPNRAAIVDSGGIPVLRLDAADSASAWAHQVQAGLRPGELAWRWRADGFPNRSRLGERDADDFAARVYLLFDYPLERVPFGQRLGLRLARALHGDALSAASICYLMHSGESPGEPLDSPYTSRVKMIVARGRAEPGSWYAERRDIAADFARCFGGEHGPGLPPVQAIVVGADSDQGGGRFAALFGDLLLR